MGTCRMSNVRSKRRPVAGVRATAHAGARAVAHAVAHAAFYILSVGMVGLAGCAVTPSAPPAPLPPTAADMTFEDISKRYLDEMVALTPVNATALGDHRFDNALDDVSASGYARRVALARELLAQLQALDDKQLSRANQVDVRLLTSELDYEIWRVDSLHEWRWNPLIYTELTGNSVYLLMARDFAPLPDRLRNVGARLAELPRFLAQVREALDPPRVPIFLAETAV
ncbi:MAG: hypothetical protein JWN85_4349 [Gammaproteobacteria bacterium]|nr:hypothetical protein [Gammaproteobacteria bacterium]